MQRPAQCLMPSIAGPQLFVVHLQSVIGLGYSTSEDDEPQLNGASSPLPPDDEGGIPHRWRVVIMMAAAFVLCNMDKVRLHLSALCSTLGRRPGHKRPCHVYILTVARLDAGEHVCGSDSHGRRAWLERDRSRDRQQRFLLGLLDHTDSSGLDIYQVSTLADL